MRWYLTGLLLLSTTPLLNAASKWDFIRQIGGSNAERVTGIARDQAGNLFIAGTTHSQDFPANVFQRSPIAASIYRVKHGTEWEPLHSQRATSVWLLAADWTRPGTLYAHSSRGLLKSTDHAQTWQRLPDGWPEDAAISALVIDPANGDTLYAASPRYGVFRSTDAGQTWERKSKGLAPLGSYPVFPDSLRIDPHNSATVFAFHRTENLPVFRSDDGGETWQPGPPFKLLSFDPTEPGLVYGARFKSLWRSRDGGATWEQIDEFAFLGAMTVDSLGRLYLHEKEEKILGVSSDQGATWTRVWLDGRDIFAFAVDPNGPEVFASAGSWQKTEIIRSSDGFANWTGVTPWRPTRWRSLAMAPGPDGASELYTTGSASIDGFLAALDPGGELRWATYLGSSGDDLVAGVGVDGSGNVYVAGQAGWEDVPVTSDAYRAGHSGGGFVTKFSPAGDLIYSSLVTDWQSHVTNLAVDPAGNVYVTGSSFGGLPTGDGVVRPHLWSHSDQDPARRRIFGFFPPPTQDNFVLKLDASGSRVDYATYLGATGYYTEPKSAPIDVDAEGHAYVAVPHAGVGRDTLLAKLSPDATAFAYNTLIASASPRALRVREDGELLLLGQTDEPDFFTTPGAFQRARGYYGWEVGQRVPAGETDAFLLRMSADGSTILRSTRLGGEADEFPRALALDRDGSPILGGATWSRGLPTREPLQGTFSRGTGFVAKMDAELSTLAFSTYAGDRRHFEVAAVTVDDEGGIIFAGHTVEARPQQFPELLEPASSSDIFLVKLSLEPTPEAPRLDTIANAASFLAGPLAPGEIVEVLGAGFGDDPTVLVNGAPITNLTTAAGRILAIVPDDVDQEEQARVSVQSAGRESNAILMPTAPGAPGIVTVDGSGHGQGFILNEDGTLNSENNRAAPGSTVTIAVTGIGRTFSAWGQTWPETEEAVHIGGWWTPVVGGELRDLPNLPGQVLLLRVPVPDPQLPHAPEFKIPPRVAVNIESGGQLSQPGVAIHLTIR